MKKLLYILLSSSLPFVSSCEKSESNQNQDDGGNLNIEIGTIYQGGFVFYLDETGEHGLVAAMEDLPGIYVWGCYSEYVEGADGTSIGTGLQNTLDIVSECSVTPISANKALAYESEGYSDWYLPSVDELIEMYNTLANSGSQGNIGGFDISVSSYYWSSSEISSIHAWNVYFNNGNSSFNYKVVSNRVRVIRAF